MIKLIVAMDKNHVIAKNGWMPWNLPEDLKHFKDTTLHQHLVMGRVTFETMKKPLVDRFTYVVTHDQHYHYEDENVKVIYDFDTLLAEYKHKDQDLFICGGSKIYTYALPYVDEMYISLVDQEYEGDVYFPKFNPSDFKILDEVKKNGFTIIHYQRKK